MAPDFLGAWVLGLGVVGVVGVACVGAGGMDGMDVAGAVRVDAVGGGAEDLPELRGVFWLGGFAGLETLGSGLGGPLEGVGERSPPPAGAPE